MTAREEVIFAQGMMLGAALTWCRASQAFVELDRRLARLERLRAYRRSLARLVPAGWRDGQRLFKLG